MIQDEYLVYMYNTVYNKTYVLLTKPNFYRYVLNA